MNRFATAALCIAFAVACAARAGADGFDATIGTLAGSGVPGYADGDVAAATFISPIGIAIGPRDDVYVADAGSQRIRRIANGTVSTLAGGGTLLPDSFWVRGGYRDGKGAEARFNLPSALAVDRGGRVYVADAGNSCIRLIQPDGTVSTFSGAPGEASETNGPRKAARFKRPMGIALDPSGDLYVADQGAGVRKISRDGMVSTFFADPGVTGVAVSPDGRALTVSNLTGGMALFLDGNRRDIPSSEPLFHSADTLHLSDLSDIGHPYAAAMIDAYRAIYTDAKNGAIRYIAFNTYTSKVVIGDRLMDGTNDRSGYRDGSLADGLVSSPLGVALTASGTLYVADSGNRRIRRIAPLNFRQALDATIGALPPEIPKGDTQNVAIVGGSYIWANCVWDDSWEGLLEKKLHAAGKRVTLYPILINDVKQDEALGYVTNVLAEIPHVDRVVFVMNPGSVGTKAADWAADYQSQLRLTRAALSKNGIDFLVALVPRPFDYDWQETPVYRYLAGPLPAAGSIDPARLDDNVIGSTYRTLQAETRDSGVPYLDVLPFFVAESRTPDARPIYGSSEGHPSAFGRQALADALFDALAQEHRPQNP